MISQAMESMTRAFYSRSDLDLILASPVAAHRLFAVRIATVGVSVAMMAMPLAAPFIDILIVRGGLRWMGAYGLIVAMGAAAAALAVGFTVALFRIIGPKRTRLVAQVVAAVIGAAFVIGLQVAAILSYGTISRISVLQSSAALAHAPDLGSIVWWPARAAMGDWLALIGVLAVSFALLAAAIALVSPRFGEYAVAASGAGASRVSPDAGGRAHSKRHRRDAPCAARNGCCCGATRGWCRRLSCRCFISFRPPCCCGAVSTMATAPLILLVPVLVMAAGQFAGGLAWLAISGEDAPDLVATAPVPAGFILRAKVEAVLGVIAFVFAPLVAVLAIALALARAGRQRRHRHRHHGGDRDPALVPQPGQAQPVPPPPGLLARGDLHRSLLVDRLGRDGRGRIRKPLCSPSHPR